MVFKAYLKTLKKSVVKFFTGEQVETCQWELVGPEVPIRGRELYVETPHQRYARQRSEYAQSTTAPVKNNTDSKEWVIIFFVFCILLITTRNQP